MAMRVLSIDTGLFKLDGGAMFGVVPKRLWQKLNPPDDNNMCTWAMRCLLIDSGQQRILVDTGIGDKQGEKFRKHFEPHGDATLIGSLARHGYRPEDITDVFLTHLHFDHCGGAVRYNEDQELVPTFPQATYWTNRVHYDWALHPNPREKASFLQENFVPLEKAGVLNFVEPDPAQSWNEWIEGLSYRLVYGHTEAMMMLRIPYGQHQLVYCADLIPSTYHIGLPYVMAYDVRPLTTLKEKATLLEEALEQQYLLFFEHDPTLECGFVQRNERGRIVLTEGRKLNEVAHE